QARQELNRPATLSGYRRGVTDEPPAAMNRCLPISMNEVSSLATAAYSRLARCEQYLLAMVIGPTSGEVCSSSRRSHSEAVEGEDTMRLSRHSVSIAAVLGLV